MARLIVLVLATLICIVPAAAKTPCETRSFEGDRFTTCAYVPGQDKIAIAWRGPAGKRLLGFSGLKAMLGAQASRLHFAVNAGMYHLSGAPVGLFIADGVQDKALNRRPGPGNFHLLPNGVFWVDGDGHAHVETTDRFAARRVKPRLATQSGPMLLIGGKLHPRIQADGPSRLIRNAVGAGPNGGAVFAISETPVSFGKMARFLAEGGVVRNALFLDGSVSSLWEPGRKRMDIRAPLGPMIWVY